MLTFAIVFKYMLDYYTSASEYKGFNMRRKIEKSKDDLIIKLPTKYFEALRLDEGDEVFISLDQDNERIIISPTGSRLAYEGVDE